MSYAHNISTEGHGGMPCQGNGAFIIQAVPYNACSQEEMQYVRMYFG